MSRMRGRKGVRSPQIDEAPPSCHDCRDEGVVYFAGILYCGRCALERLIRALRAEVDDDPELQPGGEDSRVLADR